MWRMCHNGRHLKGRWYGYPVAAIIGTITGGGVGGPCHCQEMGKEKKKKRNGKGNILLWTIRILVTWRAC